MKNTVIACIGQPSPTRIDYPILEEACRKAGILWEWISLEKCTPKTLQKYSLCFTYTCGGYHKNFSLFSKAINVISSIGIVAINPAEIVRGNSHKSYLRALEKNGIPIIQTEWIEDIHDLQKPITLDSKKLVVKPAVSAGSFQTTILDRHDPKLTQTIEEILPHSSVMVQPFLDAIMEKGELSLLYFDGAFSHAVHKQPKAGDFRVQRQFGGIYTLIENPPHEALALSEKILNTYSTMPNYARIDLWESAHGYLLNEVELIEPDLYVDTCPAAVDRFISMVQRALRAV